MSSALVTAIAAVVGVVLTVLAGRTGRKHDREQGLIEAELLAKLAAEDREIAENVRASLSRRTERWARLPSADERRMAALNGLLIGTLAGVAVAALSWIALRPDSLKPILGYVLGLVFLAAFFMVVIGFLGIALLTVIWSLSGVSKWRQRSSSQRGRFEPGNKQRRTPTDSPAPLDKVIGNGAVEPQPTADPRRRHAWRA